MALVASLYPNWSHMAQLPVFHRHVKIKWIGFLVSCSVLLFQDGTVGVMNLK